MLSISRDFVVGTMDKAHTSAASCRPGDTVSFFTRDCYDDNSISEEFPLGTMPSPMENPATGPLFVETAEPGDVLKVEILSIRLRGHGIMRSSIQTGPLHTLYSKREARIFSIKDNVIHFDDTLQIPCDTMIGVIGTAPEGDGVSTVSPGQHGGNMDCTQITAGSVLYLPVHTPGALLSLGDLHARMGDGEVFICGLETAGEVTVRVSVLKQADGSLPFPLPLPFAVRGGVCMTIQSAPTLDEANDMAVMEMEQFIKRAAGISDLKAGMLMSLLCNMIVCQVVNPLKTVRAQFPLDVLEKYGVKLP